MAIPVKKKLKILAANYVEEAKSVLIVGECEDGRFRSQIPRDALIPQGIQNDVNEKDLTKVFTSFAKDLVGKERMIVFDPDLTARIEANDPLDY